MKIDIYIGSQRCDYNEELNIEYSIRDLLTPSIIRNNKSFTIKLPFTATNDLIFKNSSSINSQQEITDTARIIIDGTEVLSGMVKLLSITDNYSILVSKTTWIDQKATETLQDLDLSAYDHAVTVANMNTSDSAAAGAFYRYPIINWGRFIGQGEVSIQDRLPIFNVEKILAKILEPYTIQSTFLSAAAFKAWYITTNEQRNTEDFIADKDFVVDYSANDINNTVIPAGAGAFGVSINKVAIFDNFVSGNILNYSTANYKYNTPAEGSYRFHVSVRTEFIIDFGITNVNPVFELELVKNDGTETVIEQYVDSTTITTAGTYFITLEIDTKYHWLEAGLDIYARLKVSDVVANPTGINLNYKVTYYNTSLTFFKNYVNRYVGSDYEVNINEWIPPIKQIDFIKGLAQAFNLVFFIDEWEQKVYCEPFPDFYSKTAEIDWSAKVDHTERPSQSFPVVDIGDSVLLSWRDDDKDGLLKEENDNSSIPAGGELIELTSDYKGVGIKDVQNQVFSTGLIDFITGNYIDDDGEFNYFNPVTGIATGLLSILPTAVDWVYRDTERIAQFNTKLLQWDGLTSGNWTFESAAKTSYPKVSPPDFADLYDDYYFDELRLIDKGRIIEMQLVLTPADIKPFTCVVNSSASDGFRAKYKLRYKNEYFYGYILRIVYAGSVAKVTVLKLQ